MHKLALISAAFVVFNACGGQSHVSSVEDSPNALPFKPDQYGCKIEDGFRLSFSTTSKMGKPMLSLNQETDGGNLVVTKAVGESIKFQEQADGQFLLAFSQSTPDQGNTNWELVVPPILFTELGESKTFETVLKETTATPSWTGQALKSEHGMRTMESGPGVGDGQIIARKASCEATYVLF